MRDAVSRLTKNDFAFLYHSRNQHRSVEKMIGQRFFQVLRPSMRVHTNVSENVLCGSKYRQVFDMIEVDVDVEKSGREQ